MHEIRNTWTAAARRRLGSLTGVLLVAAAGILSTVTSAEAAKPRGDWYQYQTSPGPSSPWKNNGGTYNRMEAYHFRAQSALRPKPYGRVLVEPGGRALPSIDFSPQGKRWSSGFGGSAGTSSAYRKYQRFQASTQGQTYYRRRAPLTVSPVRMPTPNWSLGTGSSAGSSSGSSGTLFFDDNAPRRAAR